jgi:hypothetical protein
MCYELYLSTSSTEDLGKYNSMLVHFERPGHLDHEVASILLNQAKWFIGSQSECSCTFRHSVEEDAEFREPQEWFPEEDDGIRATLELYRTIAAFVHAGHQVDCVDVWSGMEQREIRTISVSLSAVPEKTFRLFENYHFVFGP